MSLWGRCRRKRVSRRPLFEKGLGEGKSRFLSQKQGDDCLKKVIEENMTAAPQCWKIVWLDLMANSLNSVGNYLESHTITVYTGTHVFPGISIQSVKCRGWCSLPDIPWLSLQPFWAAVAQHTVMCTYRSADLNLRLQPAQWIWQFCQVDHTPWPCDGLWRRESHWCVCVSVHAALSKSIPFWGPFSDC